MSRRRREWKTTNGISVRSGWECRELNRLIAGSVPFEYEAERFPWYETVAGVSCEECGSSRCGVVRYYTPDVFLKDGPVVELKGKLTPRNRKIMVGVKKAHPDLDLRIVFQRDNKLGTKKWHRYSDWAEWAGFEYAIGSIPEAWYG